MKDLLKQNQKIWLAPSDITGALSTTIKIVENDIITAEIPEQDIPFYKENEQIEIFTIVDEGMLYFKPTIINVCTNSKTLKFKFNKEEFDILQRREYTRVDLEKEFTLKTPQKEYICKCIDISAGGMKLKTEIDLDTEKIYNIEFSLENNIPIQCDFKPIRSDKIKDKEYTVSGRFVALKNIDKIAIVQFCFKKQIENTNK